jgi:hypothetical protein
MNKKYTKDGLEKIVKQSLSFREVLLKLGLKEAGGNYVNIKKRIIDFQIDYSHFRQNVWNKGRTYCKKDISDKLVEHSTYSSGLPVSTYVLKNQLLKLEIKKHICENCNLSEWINSKIPLELHHLNGNRYDNRIDNLQLLCPNCHALTNNYRGKNMNKNN